MPNLKKFIKDLRQDFVSYLQPFPNISSKIALSLATLTFSKTRFCSHINFIGHCLNFKVIPKGFRTNFHAYNFSISCNRYFQDIDQACNTFSKNVMRATIKAMSIKRQEIDQKIQMNRSELKNVCPVVLVNSIRLKIHDLNSKHFQYLQDHKNQKLFELTGRDPNSNSKPLEQRYNVVTIPEDLPLSEPEKSILGKGLNFVPLTKRQKNSLSKRTRKNFFAVSNLKLIFMTKNKLPTNLKETNSNRLNRRSLIGHHRMANLLRLISLLKNAAWTSKNSISTKASNFQIFLKKNGLPTKILKLGTTLSSNQPTKAVPWSFGAPTFTNKKLLDN